MKRLIIFLFLALLILSTAIYTINFSANEVDQKALVQADVQDYWPAGTWRTSAPEEQGMDSGMLADMINEINGISANINSITIIRHGYLVNETYFYPYQKGIMHSLNSCTKSVVSALVGIAVNEGRINSVNDKVLAYFPDQNIANIDERKQDMEIKDLLTMSTGLNWNITDNVSTFQMQKSGNWTGFVLDQPMKEEPGTAFNYCNGASQVLGSILQKATGKDLADLLPEKLKIGIGESYWVSSPENVSSGCMGLYMQPDDMAKFGYLYLKNGNWNGQQLIPEKWIEASTKPQTKTDIWGPFFPEYGYQWWLSRFGGYAAMGTGGQFIFVVPEQDMVVVFTSGLFIGNRFLYPVELMENYILPSVKSDTPLENNKTTTDTLQKAIDTVQMAPAPRPAGVLPETAGRISGKTYLLDNSETITFWFNGSSDCTVDFNSEYSVNVGLDNDFRLNDMGELAPWTQPENNHGAFAGRWLDEKTFQVDFHFLEEGFETVYTATFDDDRIVLKSMTNQSETENAVNGKFK
jgi:CubicO group peptidase (beta-lactamase class C family)